MGMINLKNRRRAIKTIGAVAASPIIMPYLNLVHAQSATIPIGVALKFIP